MDMTAGPAVELGEILIGHPAEEEDALLESKLLYATVDLLVQPAGSSRQHESDFSDTVVFSEVAEGVEETTDVLAWFDCADEKDVILRNAVFLLHFQAGLCLRQRAAVRCCGFVNHTDFFGRGAELCYDIVLGALAGHYDVTGTADGAIDLAVVGGVGLGKEVRPAEETEVVDGNYRWDSVVEWRDKVGAMEKVERMEGEFPSQHWLFDAPVYGCEQRPPSKVRRTDQWIPVFAVLENRILCFPVQLCKLFYEMLRIATDTCRLMMDQPGVNANSHSLNET